MVFMRDCSYESVMLVLRDLIPRRPEWPPTVGLIISRMEDLSKPDELKMTAEEAWEEALQLAILTKRYRADEDHIIFSDFPYPDGIVRAVKAIGGLDKIRNSSVDDPFFRKNFMEAYVNIGERIENEPTLQLKSLIKDQLKQLSDSMKGGTK